MKKDEQGSPGSANSAVEVLHDASLGEDPAAALIQGVVRGHFERSACPIYSMMTPCISSPWFHTRWGDP